MINHRSLYAGGLACITAPGALKFSLGLIAVAYYINKFNKGIDIVLYIYFSIIITLIARTGLFVAGTGLIIVSLVNTGKKDFSRRLKYITLLFVAIILFVTLISYFNLWGFLGNRLTRFNKLKSGLYSGFFEGYLFQAGNHIPSISWETIIGTGIVSGTSGNGVYIYADGGFFRLYVAYGLILCVVFYIHFFAHLIKVCKSTYTKTVFYTLVFLAATIIIAEIKEYTLYTQYFFCTFFTIATLHNKEIESNAS